jgi:hypothetical protein
MNGVAREQHQDGAHERQATPRRGLDANQKPHQRRGHAAEKRGLDVPRVVAVGDAVPGDQPQHKADHDHSREDGHHAPVGGVGTPAPPVERGVLAGLGARCCRVGRRRAG